MNLHMRHMMHIASDVAAATMTSSAKVGAADAEALSWLITDDESCGKRF